MSETLGETTAPFIDRSQVETRLFDPSAFDLIELGNPLLATHVNVDALQPLIAGKAMRIRQHPTEPLDIVNYQPAYSHRQGLAEDPIIDNCRGLIYNRETREIVARPFQRMTELGDFDELPEGDQLVFEKLDGSLGVQYMDSNGKWCMASRGNFTHRHAEFGTQQIQEVQEQLEREKNPYFKFDPKYTYLWEMIFPEGQHVVDYGDQRRIVLLGIVDKLTGEELPLPDQQTVPFHVARQFTGEHFHSAAAMRELNFPNAEGFVVLKTNGPRAGERFKVKFPAYELRRRQQKGELEQYLFDQRKDSTAGEIMARTPQELWPIVGPHLNNLDRKMRAVVSELLAESGVSQNPLTVLDALRRNPDIDDSLREAFTSGYNQIFGNLLIRGFVERPDTSAQAAMKLKQELRELEKRVAAAQSPEQNP